MAKIRAKVWTNLWVLMALMACTSVVDAARLADRMKPPATAATPAAPPTSAATPRAPDTRQAVFNYALAPGDVIQVDVFGEANLSKEYTVGESGDIAFPLIGTIKAIGLKTAELEAALIARLKQGYLLQPKVAVSIKSYRAVYVNGQVKTPGGIPYVPGMTVRKVISLAGGFTERASKSRIYVIAEGKTESDKPRKVKLDAEIRPGDIITVEESFF